MEIYDPYMDSLDMIIDGQVTIPTLTPLFNFNHDTGDFDRQLWVFIREKYCTTPFMTILTDPCECRKTVQGHYNMRWYKNIGAMRNIYLHIDESNHLYEITTIFAGVDTVKKFSSATASLVMYLQEQLRVL